MSLFRCLVFFVDIANIGMANIALPTIQKKLGYDDGALQWVLTAYALTVSLPRPSPETLDAKRRLSRLVWRLPHGGRSSR